MTAPLVTRETELSSCFSVRPGIDAEVALCKASDLLSIALEPVLGAAMGTPLEGNQAWLTHHALESAKAIIDALWATIQLDQDGGVQ